MGFSQHPDSPELTSVGFTTGKLYAMEGTNGKPFHTDQYAVVAHGKAEKEWPFLACSDSRFTDVSYVPRKGSISLIASGGV